MAIGINGKNTHISGNRGIGAAVPGNELNAGAINKIVERLNVAFDQLKNLDADPNAVHANTIGLKKLANQHPEEMAVALSKNPEQNNLGANNPFPDVVQALLALEKDA